MTEATENCSHLFVRDAMVDQQSHALLGQGLLQLMAHAIHHRFDGHLLGTCNCGNPIRIMSSMRVRNGGEIALFLDDWRE